MTRHKGSISLSEFHKINESLDMFNDELEGINIVDDEYFDDLEGEEDEDEDGEDFDSDDDDDNVEGDTDLGIELSVDDALGNPNDEDAEDADVIDDALMLIIDEVAEEYEEESAVNAVYDAIDTLVADGSIEDIPTEADSDAEKAIWVQNSVPKVRARLLNLGIELEAGAETVGGTRY